jgi:hypothetical protein
LDARVRPQLGRGFAPNEQGVGRAKVIVISDGLWRSTFGADSHVVGHSVPIDGTRHTIIGVAPRAFDFPNHVDLWRPIALPKNLLMHRNSPRAGRSLDADYIGPAKIRAL